MTEKDLLEQIKELLLSIRPEKEFITWAKKWLSALHKNESFDNESILKSQQRALGGVENKLNRLLDMRLNDLLDDKTYKAKKRDLVTEKRSVKKKMENIDKSLDGWRDKVENALDFAYTCQKKFEAGTREEKHEIMIRIGSNLFIENKKLLIDLENEFQVLSEQKNWGKKYSNRLEPQKYTEILEKKPDLRPANPVWLPG
ncbi:hypothetical protein HQ584_06300 [Patescibacteria group bacterium]|nr:hypothetical protein [Patescibacteria group bacterium]